jgi:hypothetical protein
MIFKKYFFFLQILFLFFPPTINYLGQLLFLFLFLPPTFISRRLYTRIKIAVALAH